MARIFQLLSLPSQHQGSHYWRINVFNNDTFVYNSQLMIAVLFIYYNIFTPLLYINNSILLNWRVMWQCSNNYDSPELCMLQCHSGKHEHNNLFLEQYAIRYYS